MGGPNSAQKYEAKLETRSNYDNLLAYGQNQESKQNLERHVAFSQKNDSRPVMFGNNDGLGAGDRNIFNSNQELHDTAK
jgi:hypothetical protein